MKLEGGQWSRYALTVAVIVGSASLASAQELETETTRLPAAWTVYVGAGFEFQTSSEGTEYAIPTIAEIGLMDRLELVIEPVVYAGIRPKQGPHASGIGDLEVTLIGLVFKEKSYLPAVAVAGEIKFPTARNDLLGTGEYDYTGYLILGKKFGQLDAHVNLGYCFLGKPPGVEANNIFTFAAALQYFVNDQFHVFAEFLGNTKSSASAESNPATEGGTPLTTPGNTVDGEANGELAGGESVGTVGVAYSVTPSVDLSLGVSYDNNQAWLIHPGVMVKF